MRIPLRTASRAAEASSAFSVPGSSSERSSGVTSTPGVGDTNRTSSSDTPCAAANSGRSARSVRFDFIQVKMIRSFGLFDFAARLTPLNVSRQARSRSHFAGTRIFS